MVSTLLIDMYGKSGDLEEISSTFEDMCEMNVVSWNTLREAYCSNYQGEEEEAFHLFIELQHERCREENRPRVDSEHQGAGTGSSYTRAPRSI